MSTTSFLKYTYFFLKWKRDNKDNGLKRQKNNKIPSRSYRAKKKYFKRYVANIEIKDKKKVKYEKWKIEGKT
jgi:carboxypeptidase C (cathepsin A)